MDSASDRPSRGDGYRPLMDSKDFADLGVDTFQMQPEDTRDIAPEVIDPETNRMRVLPASYWATTTMPERAMFGHRHGIYSFPTTELATRLGEIIGGRSAIEIGAGNGVLAEALGIPGTDSRQQDELKYRLIYKLMNQPPVTYGPNIVAMHASRAVRHYKPEVVIGCWVTYKWDPGLPEAQGNEAGIDEADIMANCDTFILVGNEHTHRHSKIMRRRPALEFPDYVYSRASNGKRDMIAVWNRRTPRR